ncbi:MAG: histidine phosphatase family protein [Zhengella sp.]|uniref:SixA phosphatase family protein n=1 Tax=Zhengella sp. TaxID=2282762 RepID=UPI001D1B3A02|nr:histidine phosphatase family protein [Notoacmeibacter sp.]MCC0027357.1 histidine phosphatase family protein [Brucellaceae bacterium]
MSRLYLMRHARAAWPAPGMRDFDRPLEPGAEGDAQAIGLAMRANGQRPQKILCSSSRRTRQTWERLADGLEMDPADAEYRDELYCNDAAGYVEMIRRDGTSGSILLIGHNPMLEDLAFALSKRGGESDSATMEDGFAPCGLAVIDFETPLSEIAPGKGRLRLFMTPEDL